MIAQYIGNNQRKWDILIPELTFPINTGIHSSKIYTPAYLNYSRELRTAVTIAPDFKTSKNKGIIITSGGEQYN